MRGVLIASVILLACYDSRWGEAKRAQQHNAAYYTPHELVGPDTPTPTHNFPVHIYMTPTFVAQTADAPHEVKDLVAGANRVLEGYGAHLDLDSVSSWEGPNEDDLDATLSELHKKESADSGWTMGLIGGLPKVTASFHELGRGDVIGTHFVVRASRDLEESINVDKAFDELSVGDRAHLVTERRRHRTIAVMLHEIGHTLGAIHETTKDGLMQPAYAWTMTGFGPSSADVVRASIARRTTQSGKPMSEDLAKDLLAIYERPGGEWVSDETIPMLDRLRGTTKAPTPTATATPTEIAPKDQPLYARVIELKKAGKAPEAFELGKPLFANYPASYAVQDLRCQLAMAQGVTYEQARAECEPLMKLTRPNR